MRNSVRTLDILQSLGFTYHIDEPSRDEPFIVQLKGGDFVTVPYTFHMNDNRLIPLRRLERRLRTNRRCGTSSTSFMRRVSPGAA